MKQRYFKRQLNQNGDIGYLIDKGYSVEFAELLSARGVSSENYDEFFGNSTCFHSPLEMTNMTEAVETISYVIESGGSILIYGDYDADGLTASSLLSLFFTDNGIENNVIIPTRDEGYGLHADKVIRAFKRNYYDLVITVDCGISNAEDVARIESELGVEVIVTDHHELPDTLPDCICVNPKLGYPFPYLSGAGVAWKLVEALAGREVAAKYSCLAAIGTIGDIMPMQDENRSLIKLGLDNYNHKSLIKLAELSRCSSKITCSDIAMKITPKLNAAGRIDSPVAALELLLQRDKADTKLCEKLLALNDLRKKTLDEIVAESELICNNDLIYRERMVFLYSEKWAHGLLGIVAAKYKEKYNLPAVILTRDGDNYVGSARGIDTLDLFEIFSECKDCLVKFGGHKASVGFTVEKSRLQELRNNLAKVLGTFDKTCFEKKYYYDIELSGECKATDIIALSEHLEPMLPQDKIICRVRDSVSFANAFGKDNSHLSVMLSCGLELKGFFKFGKYAPFIRNGANVDLLCSLEIDSYSQKLCGIIEDFTLCNSVCFDGFYKLNLLKNFTTEERKFVSEEDVGQIIQKDSTILIFDDFDMYLEYAQKYDLSYYYVDVFFDNSVSSQTVAISPLTDYNFDKYNNIVYFTDGNVNRCFSESTIYVKAKRDETQLYALELSREICLKSYLALKNKSKFDSVKNVYDKYLLGKVSYEQYIVSLRVFQELGLIKLSGEYDVSFDTSQKQDLSNSSIYRCFVKQ